MERFQLDPPVDAAQELRRLLSHSGFNFREEDGRFWLVFSERGCKWQTECVCRETAVLFYSSFPFVIKKEGLFNQLCQSVDSQVVFGSLFRVEERAVFRTAADLPDAFSAYEQLARMLEYNAGVVVRFWDEVAACAAE